jgi:ABC-type glycerol-3-phosphate transport system permease component
VALVALWLFPTVGLFVSSFRTADQIANSGLVGVAVHPGAPGAGDPHRRRGRAGGWRISSSTGNLFEAGNVTTQPLGHQLARTRRLRTGSGG